MNIGIHGGGQGSVQHCRHMHMGKEEQSYEHWGAWRRPSVHHFRHMHMGKQEQSYVTEKGEGHVISPGSSRDVMSARQLRMEGT